MSRSKGDHNHRDRHWSGKWRKRFASRALRRRDHIADETKRDENPPRHRHLILWDRW